MPQSHLRVSVGLTLVFHVFASRGDCSQRVLTPALELRTPGLRVVFPYEEAVDSAKAQLLVAIFDSQTPIRGLPLDILTGERITISLAAEPTHGVDGTSYPMRRVIVLPLVDAFEWEREKLRRVIRHELAHVATGIFLDYALLPRWFEEGFAESAAGALTCEAELRIRLELMVRKRRGQPAPQLLEGGGFGRVRLFYDLWATFFAYVDEQWGGVVTDGRLLEGVRAHGVNAGLPHVLSKDLGQLEQGWQSYLLNRYADLPERFSCERDGW